MCIAIPPPLQPKRSSEATLWRLIAGTPWSLLLFAAMVELLLFAPVLLGMLDTTGALPLILQHQSGFFLFFILLPTLFFGMLLSRYPSWLRGVPPRYTSYFLPFLFFLGGSGLLVLGWLLIPGAAIAGLVLILVAWLTGFRTLWFVYTWAPNPDRQLERLMNLALLLGFAALLSGCLGEWVGSARIIDLSIAVAGGLSLLPLLALLIIRESRFFSRNPD